MGPLGVKISTTVLFLQNATKSFETCLEFSSQSQSLHKTTFVFFLIFEFPIFNYFFSKISNSPLQPIEKSKTSIIWKTSERRAKRSEIWEVVVQHIWGTFDLLAFNCTLGSFGALSIFSNLGLMIRDRKNLFGWL